MTHYAFVRAERIRDRSEMARLALHGRRLDPTGTRRADATRTPFNPAGSNYVDDPLDLVLALNSFLAETGTVLYGRAPIALHLIVGVSPAWIRDTGGLHDPANPRNVALAREAVAWTEAQLGGDEPPCVIAWRLDLDEAGGGLVDVFAAPTRVARLNKVTQKRIVSVTPALEALNKRYPDATAFGALQTSWADHARATLSPALMRGVPRAERPASHLDPDRYGRLMDAAKEHAAQEAERVLSESRASLDARERMVAEAEARVGEHAAAFERSKATALQVLKQRAQALVAREREATAAERDLTDARVALELGVTAFGDGRIAAVKPDPETGRPWLLPGDWVDASEWSALMVALGPGVAVGLLEVLERLQAGADRAAQAGARLPSHDWSPRP